MPVDPGHHRLLHPTTRTRYTPLPHYSPPSDPNPAPAPRPTQVSLGAGGRTTVTLRPQVARPCHRHRGGGPPPPSRYSRLTPTPRTAAAPGSAPGLLRAVTSRGRGYHDLCAPRGKGSGGGDDDDSGGSSSSPRASPQDSPEASPPPRRSILITSALARSGIRRLARVSFGSSKGSMVETLIYDSPVAEEERIPEEDLPPFKDPVSQKFGTETGTQQKPASKVRVTFYESSKPLVVTSPEPSDLDPFPPHDLIMTSPLADPHMVNFDRQLSTESGRDNPFRPDGDISREADEIVELIKSGRPLDAQQLQQQQQQEQQQQLEQQQQIQPQQQQRSPDALDSAPAQTQQTSPKKEIPKEENGEKAQSGVNGGKSGVNGAAAGENSAPGTVEVTHATVTPTDAAHVEHVVIKKKSKCGCCVIQ